jgi:hypothetical protein
VGVGRGVGACAGPEPAAYADARWGRGLGTEVLLKGGEVRVPDLLHEDEYSLCMRARHQWPRSLHG